MATLTASKHGERLRALAASTEKVIVRLSGPRLENTPKRQAEGMAARADAANHELVRRAMVALADAWDAGAVPERFAKLTTRAAIEPLVTHQIDHPSYYVIRLSEKWRDESDMASEFRAYIDSLIGDSFAEQDVQAENAARIRELEEQIRFAPIEGFFPTPPALIERMLNLADIQPYHLTLEPSAGKGDIAEAVVETGSQVVCFEIVPTLANICRAKGLVVEGGDFLAAEPAERFDRVLMNPPFERLQDCEHVRAAYAHLRPGGRLVSVMSASMTFNRAAESFRAWLSEIGAEVYDVDPNAFRNAFRSTSVQTKLVVLDKPR